MRIYQHQSGRTVGTSRIALVCLAILAGAPFAQAGTLHFLQNDIVLGELIEGATPTQVLTLGRSGNGTSASTVTYSAGLILGGSAVTGNEVKVMGNAPPAAGALSVSLDGTAAPGAANWTVQLNTATAGQDNLVALTATILAHANGSFDASIDLNELVIDFGNVALGSTQSQGFSLFNLPHAAGAAFTADLDVDSFLETDTDGKFSTDLSTATIIAGQSAAYSVAFDTSAVGSFTAQYTLNLSDEDLQGEENQVLTISVMGNVVPIPEPGSLALLGMGALLLPRRRR